MGLRRGDDGGWLSEVDHYTRVRQPPPGDPDAPALRVAVRGSGVSAPEEPHRLVFIGGGPMSGAVHLFDRLFTEAMRRVCGPSGQAWWQDAGISGSIETLYDEDGTRPAVRGRLVGQELRVRVVRPLETLGRGVDVAGLAEADAAAIVALLRRRTRLGPHPELPGA